MRVIPYERLISNILNTVPSGLQAFYPVYWNYFCRTKKCYLADLIRGSAHKHYHFSHGYQDLNRMIRAKYYLPTIAIGLAINLSIAGEISADSTRREFPQFKFRFTLPGSNWVWLPEGQIPGATFAASNELQTVVGIIVATTASRVDSQIADLIDKELLKRGGKKRNGNMVTFHGVPCYELSFALDAAHEVLQSRIFIAHGFVYEIQVIEREPSSTVHDYSALFAGFDFSSPPPPPQPNSSREPDVTHLLVMLGGFAVIFGIYLYYARKNKL